MPNRGRPSKYTEEVADEICRRLSEGESLRAICRDDAMPEESTVRNWVVTDHEGFFAQYARAREAQADYWGDEIIEIADDGSNDYMATEHGEKLDSEHVQRSRLRVDTRKWLMARMAPKKYGDKVAMEHSGAGGGPLTVQIVRFGDGGNDE